MWRETFESNIAASHESESKHQFVMSVIKIQYMETHRVEKESERILVIGVLLQS